MARNVVIIRIILVVVVALLASTAINARDLGQFDDPANADLKRWYQDLKQPDNPAVPCCGEADAYWADAFEATSDGFLAASRVARVEGALGDFLGQERTRFAAQVMARHRQADRIEN